MRRIIQAVTIWTVLFGISDVSIANPIVFRFASDGGTAGNEWIVADGEIQNSSCALELRNTRSLGDRARPLHPSVEIVASDYPIVTIWAMKDCAVRSFRQQLLIFNELLMRRSKVLDRNLAARTEAI
jgi:hypothetical protein